YVKARKRLAFEELLILQLGLFLIKSRQEAINKGIQFPPVKEVYSFIEDLPFKLTKAQMKVFREVEKDMESHVQMNRLILVYVGSGKISMAVLSIFKAWKPGYQSVLMAPSEILPQQNFNSISKYFKDYDIRCE